jgi:hypothetical protein
MKIVQKLFDGGTNNPTCAKPIKMKSMELDKSGGS